MNFARFHTKLRQNDYLSNLGVAASALVVVLAATESCRSQTAPQSYTVEEYQLSLQGDGVTLIRNTVVRQIAFRAQVVIQDLGSSEVPAEQHRKGWAGRDGKKWLQVIFRDFNLGERSALTIRSATDGEEQVFTQRTLSQSEGRSAFFNGKQVQLDLDIAAGEKDVFVETAWLLLGTPPQLKTGTTKQSAASGTKEALCGRPDIRVGSSDKRIGRLLPAGCTGFMIGTNAFLTAGHCTEDNGGISHIQFDVPPSQSDGTLTQPHVADQYSIDSRSVRPHPGDANEPDWALFSVVPNSNTGKLPSEVQGKGFDISRGPMPAVVRVTGYGESWEPRGSGNYSPYYNSKYETQQTDTGKVDVSRDPRFIGYEVETEGGNSGSPVIATTADGQDTNRVVAIHTDAKCNPGGSGTAIEEPGLQAAIHDVGVELDTSDSH